MTTANHHTTLAVSHDPSPEAQMRLRSSHLKHAVDLFGMLNSVMDSTAPNRRNITHSTDPDVKVSDAAVEIHKLETELDRGMRSLHVSFNESKCYMERLPDDILLHIFQIPFNEEWRHQVRWSITISHVCTRWRRIAVRTAAMWAMVCFSARASLPPQVSTIYRSRYDEDGRYRRPHNRWSNSQMLTFLLRSRGTGLASELKIGPELNNDSIPQFVNRFVDLCASRTDNLTFTFKQTPAHPKTMAVIMPCMRVLSGHLRRLKVSFPTFTEYDMGGHMSPLFQTCMPCLEEVAFHNVPLTRHNGDYRMLATCKKLSIVATPQAYFSPEVFVPLLRSAQQLRELRIDISTSWLMPPSPTQAPRSLACERVVLPYLVKYVVATGAWMERAFEFFAAPRLRWLEMDTERCDIPPWTFDAPIYEFLEISNPPVETFVVRHPSNIISHLLRQLPTIRQVVFLNAEADYGSAYKQILNEMTQSVFRLESKPICPELEVLCTDMELAEPTHLYSLYDFTAIRNEHGMGIKRLFFRPGPVWDFKVVPPQAPQCGSSPPLTDETGSSPGSEASMQDAGSVYETGYRRWPTPELWLDYFEPEPVRGDRLIAQEVGQFIMGNHIFDLETDRWEDDTAIVRREERFFHEHMTRRDGFVSAS